MQTSTARVKYKKIMSQAQDHYDILVVGKAGNGKSAVCNTLLGAEKCATGRSMTTTTTTAEYNDCRSDNMTIRVIDTPDITNCGMNETEKGKEIEKWKRFIPSPHPSLVLITVRCDVRYTAEEFAIYREMERRWGSMSLKKRLVVAFTFGDRLDHSIVLDVKNPPPELKQLLKKAKGRYMVFTNKDDANRPAQAQECFALMRGMQRNKGLLNCMKRLCCFCC